MPGHFKLVMKMFIFNSGLSPQKYRCKIEGCDSDDFQFGDVPESIFDRQFLDAEHIFHHFLSNRYSIYRLMITMSCKELFIIVITNWHSLVPVLCFLYPLQKLVANEWYKF